MMFWKKLVAAASAMAVPVLGAAEPAWDGFGMAPAVMTADGSWFTCPKGSEFPFTAQGKVPQLRCVHRKVMHEEEVGQARRATLQEIVDEHIKGPGGRQVKAVGPLPLMQLNMTANMIDPTWVFIAYKFGEK